MIHSRFRAGAYFAAACLFSAGVSAPLARGQASELKVVYGPDGVTSLSWQGREFLAKKTFEFSAGLEGKPYQFGLRPVKTEGTGEKITRVYELATVTTTFKQVEDRLLIDLELHNTSNSPITKSTITTFQLGFPALPKGWRFGRGMQASSYGEPAVATADYGTGLVLLCQEDFETPARIGFANQNGGTDASLQFTTLGNSVWEDLSIPPGGTVNAHLSLRFGGADETVEKLAGDIYASFAKRFPATLHWTDNRPIGALFLAQSAKKWETNPRGWLNDNKLNITTADGREEFRKRLMEYADHSIACIQAAGGQGMITWDIEGGEFPHATTYLGDPRALPIAAPEMDPFADEYFKKFLDAGLRTGICIRPTKIIETDSVKMPWTKNRLDHWNDVDPVETLCEKIAYAKKRWGCTIFYLDTPGLYRVRDGKPTYYQLPPHVLRKVTERFPDILLFPEFSDTGICAVGARYGELASANRTSDEIRRTYPKAFTCYAIKDCPIYPDWEELVTGAMNGDILMFRGWMKGQDGTRARQVWQEADFRKKPMSPAVTSAGSDPTKLIALLSDPVAVVRYQATAALGEARAATAVPALAALVQNDPEWVIRRAAAQALGRIGGPVSIAALESELLRKDSDLLWFAATALAETGPAAIPALSAALDSLGRKNWDAVAAGAFQVSDKSRGPLIERILTDPDGVSDPAKILILKGLAENPDPAFLQTVAALTTPGPGFIRGEINGRAAEALGAMKDERAIAPLLALLDRTDKGLYYAKKAAMRALEDITSRSGKTQTSGGENAEAWRKLLGNSPSASEKAP